MLSLVSRQGFGKKSRATSVHLAEAGERGPCETFLPTKVFGVSNHCPISVPKIYSGCMQLGASDKTPVLSCLLEGPVGSGKSALAASAAKESGFPFVKVITPETLAGMSEQVSM